MAMTCRQLVEAWKQAWVDGDKARLWELTAEDFEWWLPRTGCWLEQPVANPEKPVVVGRERFLEISEHGGGMIYRQETMQVENRLWVEQGNHAVEEWTMRVTAHNGAPYLNHYVNIWSMNDKGQLCRSAEYLDTAYWEATLLPGLLSKVHPADFAASHNQFSDPDTQS